MIMTYKRIPTTSDKSWFILFRGCFTKDNRTKEKETELQDVSCKREDKDGGEKHV